MDPLAGTSTTASNTAPAPPVSLEALLQAMIKAVSLPQPDPIGEWMRDQGFPPETSLLILPETMRSLLDFPPRYVKFSVVASSPMLVKDLTRS